MLIREARRAYLPREDASRKASRISRTLSFGRPRETTNLCRHDTAGPANLALRVLHAIINGLTKCGLRLKSVLMSISGQPLQP